MILRTTMLIILTFAMAGQALCAEGKRYTYRETTDGEVKTTRVVFLPGEKSSAIELEYWDGSYRLVTNAASEVQECKASSKQEDRKTVFRRRGNMMIIRSGENGVVNSVDDLPWLQTPFNLSSFIVSGQKSKKFLVSTVSDLVDDDNEPGSVITMVAKNNGPEIIECNGQEISADRVTITLTGFKSLFWKITYWYRPADGIVLKYREARGGSGTAATFGELVAEEIIDPEWGVTLTKTAIYDDPKVLPDGLGPANEPAMVRSNGVGRSVSQ